MNLQPRLPRPPALPAVLLLAALCPAPVHALTHRIVVSAVANGYEGWSVACAGDLNGDGVPDLIAGGFGEARVLFLGAAADTGWDRVLTSDVASDQFEQFGGAVAGGKDLDGDGQIDLVVSDPEWSLPNCGHNSCFAHGRVYVLPKSAAGAADASMTAESGQEFDELGWTIAILPDFNGDGSPDLAAAGRQGALMWFGGAALDSIPDRDWPSSGQVSRPLAASAGDWNGDGYGDFVCAAAPGGVQVVFGGPGADTNVDRTLGAPDYAFSIAGGGDLNGDGYDDIAVGFAGGTSGSGRVEVYFGGATADSIGDLTLFPPLPDATFGWSTAIAGDVNGDGYADLAVGSWWNDGAVHSGRVYVYLGGPQFDAVVDDTLESAGAFGMSLAGLGDVTGDGRADLAIGSLYEPNPGQVYVVSFSSDVGSPPPGPVVDALHLSVRGNPARGEVHLALALDRDAPVTLTIHDLAGREVARPLDHARVAGGTETTWSPGPLPAGVYLARLSVGDRSAVARCVWLGP